MRRELEKFINQEIQILCEDEQIFLGKLKDVTGFTGDEEDCAVLSRVCLVGRNEILKNTEEGYETVYIPLGRIIAFFIYKIEKGEIDES